MYKRQEPTFKMEEKGRLLEIIIRDEFFTGNTDDKFYYHIIDESGTLDEYKVLKVQQKNILELGLDDFDSGKKIVLFYKGYKNEYIF